MDEEKIIIKYLEEKLLEVKSKVERLQKEYPTDESFCYECGNHTHDPSYNEKIQENFLLSEIENLTPKY
tara:strand:+ start:62 stop:268 length:207 start_codon:yes stop_codon:yes gene_type:complete